jgi:hypothetical protein
LSTTAIFGQIYTLSGDINGAQAMGGVGTGSAGTGTISGTYDAGTGIMDITATFSGLTFTVTAAHIHGPAGPGVNAGVTQALFISSGTATSVNVYAPYPDAEADLIAGLTYVNIHTVNYPGGEIRGQITATLLPPVPALGTWAIIVLGLVMSIGGLVFLSKRKLVAT